jgi:hypothetical protein
MAKYIFGNSDATLINDLDVKNKIINYLFHSVNLSNYRFNMLDDIQQLNFLKNNKHFVSPNFKGYNYFLIFTKVNNISYCVLIDRKKFSYHKNKVNIKMVKIIKLKIRASSSMFRGSIFDAKLIFNKEKYIMLIKDCYKIIGNDLTKMEMNEKMTYLNNILNNQISDNPYFDIKINKLFDYETLDDLINNIIPSSKLDIQGLIFYPKYSGIQIIYTNGKKQKKVEINSNENIKNSTFDMITNIKNILKSREYSYEQEGKKEKLKLEKTNIIDVYNVIDNENSKLGIAHIPSLKISSYCQDIFKEVNEKLFLCVYNNNFKKWIPLKTI